MKAQTVQKTLKQIRRTNETVIALMLAKRYQNAYELVRDTNQTITTVLARKH